MNFTVRNSSGLDVHLQILYRETETEITLAPASSGIRLCSGARATFGERAGKTTLIEIVTKNDSVYGVVYGDED